MIIGVVGFLGSGKGTVCDLLVSDYGFAKMAFADPVKDATAVIFGWPRELLEGDTDASRAFRETPDAFWSEKFGFPVTPRWAMQKVGTEGGRVALHDSVWVSSLERRLPNQNVAVADVRFPNEIAKIRELGGHVIRVVRGPEPEWYYTAFHENTAGPGEVVEERMADLYPNVHYSEWAWIGEKFDYVLDNNGSKRDLEANLSYVLKAFTGPGREVPKNIVDDTFVGVSPMTGPSASIFAMRAKNPVEEKVAS